MAAPSLSTEVIAQTACFTAITVIPTEICNKIDGSSQTDEVLDKIQNTSSSGVSMQNGDESDKENIDVKEEDNREMNGQSVDLTKKLLESLLHNQNGQ